MSDKEHNDGGPAFPDALRPGGMSLRDWFAATLPLTPSELDLVMSKDGCEQHTIESRLRYQKADAMLAARKEKQ